MCYITLYKDYLLTLMMNDTYKDKKTIKLLICNEMQKMDINIMFFSSFFFLSENAATEV